MPRLANSQLVAGSQQLVEVLLLCRDVGHDDDDVNDRLGGKARHRRGSDVLDIDACCRQRIKDPTPVMSVVLRPPGVIVANADLELFWTADDLDRRDVRPSRLVAVRHQRFLPVVCELTI
jgi:hypothetical protein